MRTAAAVEETKSFRRRTVTEDASQDEKKERSKKREKSARVRVFPIWLRIIIVTILCAFALVTGLMIGYGVLGDGAPIDALKVETWRHIIDIVIKE
ncbi:DNA-directed RNA polymerase subunit beta [Oceanobacillus luteolus]|nr:DNA-directed RNA polymerase subunit beta [Oceanobacillus luteolus]